MSLGDHDTFSMYGCPASLRREAFALPPNDAPLAAPFTLAVDTRLRVGLDSLGYPVVAGEDAAASALRHLGAARADSRSLDRLLDEHGGRGAEETLPDAVRRVLAAKDKRICALSSSVAEQRTDIDGLRVDSNTVRMAFEHAQHCLILCGDIVRGRGGFVGSESLHAALLRLLKGADSEIIARSRRIEELRVAGESLSTVMGQLSAAEADLAQEKARAAKAEAEVDRLRENARATNAHANIATCFGNGFVEAMEAHGVPLHDQNPLGLRRILGERSALEGDLVREQGRAEKLCADHKRQIDGLWTQITDGATREELLRGRAQKAEADVARLSAPVDDDAIALARCKIGLALYDANRGIAGNALCDGYLKTGDAALQKAIADILRSLVRQAPNAVADDEGKRLLAGIDAAIKQIEKEAAEWHVGATKCATQTYPGPDYAEAARSDNRADALERAAWLIGYHTKTKR